MPRPFLLLDAVDTPDGRLELRRRGDNDMMISIGGRVLMSSAIHRSEVAVAALACQRIRDRRAPRVLIGGLGLGYTLRAALDALPRTAQVVVAELNEAVARWCRGEAASLTAGAASDPRVEIVVGDVADTIRAAARSKPFDAIIVDLYLGPDERARGDAHPLYGVALCQQIREALTPGGVYSVWSEEPSPSFERRLRGVGLDVSLDRPQGGGPRHVVYLAQRPLGAVTPGAPRAGMLKPCKGRRRTS